MKDRSGHEILGVRQDVVPVVLTPRMDVLRSREISILLCMLYLFP